MTRTPDLRSLMKIVEGFYDRQDVETQYFTGAVDIHVDPTRAELGKMLREFGSLRGFFDPEHVYVWRGDVLHHDVEVPGDHWIEWAGKGVVLIAWNWDTSKTYEGVEDVADIEGYVREHPALKRLVANMHVIARSR